MNSFVKTIRSFRIFTAILLIIYLTACNTNPTYDVEQPWWFSSVYNTHDSIEIVDIVQAYSAVGDTSLAITFQNESALGKQVAKYRVEWFQDNGMPMNSILSRWNTISLLPEQISTIQAVSPGNKAASFRLSVVAADNQN